MLITFEISAYEDEYVLPRAHSCLGFVVVNWGYKNQSKNGQTAGMYVDFSDFCPTFAQVVSIQGVTGHTNYPGQGLVDYTPGYTAANGTVVGPVSKFTTEGHASENYVHLLQTSHGINPVPVNVPCDIPERITLRVLGYDEGAGPSKAEPFFVQIETLEIVKEL
jgi:hypothetical protein